MSINFKTEEYYRRFIELQDKLRKSEDERLKLEMKFNEMVQTTKEEKQFHCRRLRSKYKRFLEADRRRQDRNERILVTLERIENRIAMIMAKTDRCKLLREQYRRFLDRMYSTPNVVETPETKSISGTDHYEIKPDYENDVANAYMKNLSSQRLRNFLQMKKDLSVKIPSVVTTSDMYEQHSDYDSPNLYDNIEHRPNNTNLLADEIISTIYHCHNQYSDATRVPKESSSMFPPTPSTMKKEVRYETPKAQVSRKLNYSHYDSSNDSNTEDISEVEISDLPKNKSIPTPTFAPEKVEQIQTLPNNLRQQTQADLTPKLEQTLLKDTFIEKSSKPITEITTENQLEDFSTKKPEELDSTFNNVVFAGNDDLKQISSKSISHEIVPEQQESVSTVSDKQNISDVWNKNVSSIKSEDMSKDDKDYNNQQQLSLVDESVVPKIESIDEKPTNTLLPETQVSQDITQSETPKIDEAKKPDESSEEPVTNDNEKQELESCDKDATPQEYNNAVQPIQQNSEISPQEIYEQDDQPQYEDQVVQEYDEIEQPDPMQQYTNQSQFLQCDENGQPLQQYDENQQYMQEYDGQYVPQYQGQYEPQYDENGQLIAQYDENGQIIQQYGMDGQPLQYDESGQPVLQFDESGQPLQQYENPQQRYDEHGQLLQQYDENGQLLQQFDENGQPIQQYDESGQPLQLYEGQILQQYDETGQPLQQYDESGQPVQQYDESGQLLQQYDVNKQSEEHFDANGQPSNQYNGSGQPVQQETGQLLQQHDVNKQSEQPLDENRQPTQQPYNPELSSNKDVVEPQGSAEKNLSSTGEVSDISNKNLDQQLPEPKIIEQSDEEVVKKSSNVMDILDTDTESCKQDTKISNDSDFDFSNP